MKIAWIFLALILAAVTGLVAPSWVQPRVAGDQRLYVALAMKWERGGYNLREVNVTGQNGFAEFHHVPGERGTMLGYLEREGVGFYDQPMFHQPPLFPAILNWSHDIFAAGKPYRLLAVPGDKVETIPWRDRLGGQFYACVLPWLSGLLLVVASFWLGREGESGRVGLLAAGALAFSPTFLMSASHVWSDTLLALWVTVGLVAVMRGCRQGNVWWCTAGGLALGLALLTKNVALLSLAVLGGIVWWMRAKGGTGKCVGVSLAFAVLVSAGWFVTIWRVMGSPLFAPTVVGVSQSQDWFRLLNAQPWYAYFVSVPYQMPVLLLGYGAMFRTKWNGLSVVLTVWACVYLVGLTWLSVWDEMIGPEPRYMLPAYPALAVLAATMMERLAKKVGWWAVGLVGAGAVMWSVSLFVKSRQWGVIWDPL